MINVLVVGGHGKIGLRLLGLLAQRGDVARGLIRDPAHAEDLEAIGAYPVLDDLEAEGTDELAHAVEGADAVVFAAGAGPGSGGARKVTMDLGGALKTIAAAEHEGARRYVMVSAMGAASPPAGDDVFAVYLRAKAAADDALRASDLDWTVLRPGRLTDDPGADRVALAPRLHPGAIPRADVAAVLAEILHADATIGATLDLVAGPDSVAAAVAAKPDDAWRSPAERGASPKPAACPAQVWRLLTGLPRVKPLRTLAARRRTASAA